MIEGKKILITGANGFIGSYISKALADKNKIFAVGRKKPEIECEFIEADLENDLKIDKLPDDIDIVIHLAARIDPTIDTKNYFNLNVASTLSLLEYSKKIGVKKFVYFSTGSVYEPSYEAIKEEHPLSLKNNSIYGFTKAVSDIFVQRYSKDMITLIIRPFHVYGHGQDSNRFIVRVSNRIKNSEKIIVFNGGDNPKISLIYVEDFVNTLLKALELQESNIFNFTSSECMTIKDMAVKMGEILDKKVNFEYIEDKNKKNAMGDVEKIKKVLGFEQKKRFFDWLEEFLKD